MSAAYKENRSVIKKNQLLNFRLRDYFLICFIIVLLVPHCKKSSPINADSEKSRSSRIPFEYHWISDINFRLLTTAIPHDNRILETPNFLTFSDACDDITKLRFAQIAEEAFSELKQAFEISSSEELGITDRSTIMTIYSNRYRDVGMRAFAFGFVLYSIDSPQWEVYMDFARYKRILKHESMHVLQHLFGLHGKYGGRWPEVWFSEGLAEYVSGGASYPFTTIEEVNEWRQFHYNTNPVSIHEWIDFPSEEYAYTYWPMFGLAVKYLLDEKGHGKTLLDVKNMFYDMLLTDHFKTSFETYMEISLEYFEEQFF